MKSKWSDFENTIVVDLLGDIKHSFKLEPEEFEKSHYLPLKEHINNFSISDKN